MTGVRSATAAPSFPRAVEDIGAEWLTAVLQPGAPGIRVDDVAVIDVAHGACTKVRMGLRTNRNDFPTMVLMKIGLEAHSPVMAGMHVNEYHAYRDLLPTVELNAPKCFAAECDDDGRAMVILEDLCLREVRFLSLQEPIGFDLAAAFLDGLARLHARWWDSPELTGERFAWVPTTAEEHFTHYFGILLSPERFARFADAPRCAAMPKVLLDPPRIRAAQASMREAHRLQPLTINHGDMHLGNLYQDADGTPGYLDSQPRLAPWSLDVSYFLIAGLDLVDRRRWEGALLQRYLSALANLGVTPPSFDEAWAAYRRDVVWGLLIWMLNGSEFQTESNNAAAAARFAMAMIDHDTFASLGV